MIQPYMIGLWIGFLSFVFVFCTIMDMVTSSKDDDVVISYQNRPLELELEEEVSVSSSYLSDDYDDIDNMIEED